MSPDAWMAAPAEAEADAPADSDAPAEAAADSDGAVEAPADALAPAWLLFEPQAAVNSASAESRARPLARVVGMRSSSGGGPGGSPRCSSGRRYPARLRTVRARGTVCRHCLAGRCGHAAKGMARLSAPSHVRRHLRPVRGCRAV